MRNAETLKTEMLKWGRRAAIAIAVLVTTCAQASVPFGFRGTVAVNSNGIVEMPALFWLTQTNDAAFSNAVKAVVPPTTGWPTQWAGGAITSAVAVATAATTATNAPDGYRVMSTNSAVYAVLLVGIVPVGSLPTSVPLKDGTNVFTGTNDFQVVKSSKLLIGGATPGADAANVTGSISSSVGFNTTYYRLLSASGLDHGNTVRGKIFATDGAGGSHNWEIWSGSATYSNAYAAIMVDGVRQLGLTNGNGSPADAMAFFRGSIGVSNSCLLILQATAPATNLTDPASFIRLWAYSDGRLCDVIRTNGVLATNQYSRTPFSP